ncbi:MAG: hypothetical protein JW810_02550 [Sedimentisphaerales bacterium]|nr:hypothetical protein [Sedimentisphaerales bacterium]
MMRISRRICFAVAVLACSVMMGTTAALTAESAPAGAADPYPADRQVMAFYYPWYGIPAGPGGAGRTLHWGRIDATNHDIAASTHYPELGAYDSHDPKIIDQHCRWARQAAIDAFIVSWWDNGGYEDRAMVAILDACQKHGLKACIYYEAVPAPKDAAAAAGDLRQVLTRLGGHPAYLRVRDKPVVFIYVRALNELGLLGWRQALKQLREGHPPGCVAIGDQFSYGAARVFDGVHTYNTAGMLAGQALDLVQTWAAESFDAWARLARQAGKISTLTIIPGYDDTKIRHPGLSVDRQDTRLYRLQWQQALRADPDWILITSFNEWHEGSEIEPSWQDGRTYLELTGQFARQFKAAERRPPAAQKPAGHQVQREISPAESDLLRKQLDAVRIGVLPQPESMAFWWLLDQRAEMELLDWNQLLGEEFTAERYPLLLYAAGEHYRPSVQTAGDIDAALRRYLESGGLLIAMPQSAWPFYYDEQGRAVNHSDRFGLTLRMGPETPPAGEELAFVQPERNLRHLPQRFAFPAGGDRRWRPLLRADHVRYVPLLQLQGPDGRSLGEAAAYGQLPGGGGICYCWFGLLTQDYSEALLHDLFSFLLSRR